VARSKFPHIRAAVLAPGYGGSERQPLLVALGEALGVRGIVSKAVGFGLRRPSPGYVREQQVLEEAWESFSPVQRRRLALVGRSFGGRMSTFLAARRPPAALVVLGYPIEPPGKPRPADMEALKSLLCPTLIVQGDRDELGPLKLLKQCARRNPNLTVRTLEDTGHDFGRQTASALEETVQWLLWVKVSAG
jgi:uncharacterized protein